MARLHSNLRRSERVILQDCQNLLSNRSPAKGSQLFREYVVTTITGPKPEPLALCDDENAQCTETALTRWESIQAQTEAAYKPCTFTRCTDTNGAIRPTLNTRKTYCSERQTSLMKRSITFITPLSNRCGTRSMRPVSNKTAAKRSQFPTHNMGNGISFELAQATEKSLKQRGQYERLIEIALKKKAPVSAYRRSS